MADDSGERRDQDNIWYSFRTEELELLLAAAGAKNWYGPAGGDPGRPVSREEVNRLLAGMYRKGIVTFADGRLLMAEDQKKIAEIIRDAHAVASPVFGVKSGIPYIAYFCRGKAAVLRTDIAGSGKVIIKMIDEADWPGFLIGECQEGCRSSGRSTAHVEAELKINGEGLRRAGTELAGCSERLKRLSSEMHSTLSETEGADRSAFKSLDDAEKALELNGRHLGDMAGVLVRIADEADRAEKMILDHEALMKVVGSRPVESDLRDMAEKLQVK